MIAYLSGKVHNKGQGYLIILVAEIGYKVYVNPTVYADYGVGDKGEFYIHQHIKEDASDLYGFKNMEELEMFELLIGVSGIGPKSALGVLSISDLNDIKETISQGDPSLMVKVSGIGKKTAERIVLELREKVAHLSGFSASGKGMSVSGEEIDALLALGYTIAQAREALKQVDPKVKDSGERIREALKGLGK